MARVGGVMNKRDLDGSGDGADGGDCPFGDNHRL